jgi:hypothetical protein
MSSQPKYFQGLAVSTGQVSASTASTFLEVVEKFRVCPVLAIKHADFIALDQKKRDEIKQVPYFVAACFRESPSPRVYAEATHCNLIFLDIDPEKVKTEDGKWVENGRYPAAPFVRDPRTLHTALHGLNFAVYLTASHTPSKPRIRIVVGAHRIPVKDYPRAVEYVASLLGLPSITRESKVAVQPMYLPVMFSDSTDEDHPLLTYADGRDVKMAEIGDSEDTPELDKNGANSQPRKSEPASIDALEFLRAPLPEITFATAKEALEAIDADCSRPDWLNCAAALKHQFGHTAEEEALALFDEWSSTGQKYGGAKETKKIWGSLRPTPIGRLPITIRSLLRAAEIAGWDSKKLKESTFSRLIRWIEEVDTVSALTEDGPRKIIAAPLLSATQEDILINHIVTNVKKRFAYPMSPTSVRKAITNYRQEIRSQEQVTASKREPDWARGVLYIASTQDFYRHRTGERFKKESFDSLYSRKLLPKEEDLRNAGLPVTPKTLALPIISPSDYALNHLKITTVYDYAYDPSQPTEVFFVSGGRKYVNTYCPTYPDLAPEHAERAGELFQSHLCHLIAEPEYRRTIIDYFASLVQAPGRKIRWAILIQSVEGAGKTYLAEAAKAVLGGEHVKIISGDSIKSGYNEWSFGHQVVVLEEVRVAGTNKYEVMNALKPLITNDFVSVNQKFRDTREVRNISNYLLFSNHHDALALQPGDRRYFVVKSPIQHKRQVLALGENYFPPLYALLREQPGALRSFFADWNISNSFQADGHAPRTKYVQDLINDSASDVASAVRRLLLEGDYPLIQYDIVSAKTILDALHIEESLTRVSAQQLAQVLREEGFRQIGRHLFGADRHYLWVRSGVDESTAPAIAAERVKKGLKNLCMELVHG